MTFPPGMHSADRGDRPEPVRNVDLLPRLVGAVGLPIGHDVVVGLVLGRDLGEFDASLAPFADRLDPVAGPLVIMGLKILVVFEDPIALHQAEAAGIVVAEGRDRLLGRVAQWPPDPLAGPRMHEQAVRIVQFGPEIVGALPVVLALVIHRGEGCEAQIGDGLARKQGGGDLEGGLPRRVENEAVGARHRRAVEQGIDGDAVRVRASASGSRIPGNREIPRPRRLPR